MVDAPEEGVVDNGTLLERLHDAPKKISIYVSKTTKSYVVHVLGLVKSYWPKANLSPLANGMVADSSEEKIAEYVEEVGPMAHKIVESLDQIRTMIVS
jgi:hypothetical protein